MRYLYTELTKGVYPKIGDTIDTPIGDYLLLHGACPKCSSCSLNPFCVQTRCLCICIDNHGTTSHTRIVKASDVLEEL